MGESCLGCGYLGNVYKCLKLDLAPDITLGCGFRKPTAETAEAELDAKLSAVECRVTALEKGIAVTPPKPTQETKTLYIGRKLPLAR